MDFFSPNMNELSFGLHFVIRSAGTCEGYRFLHIDFISRSFTEHSLRSSNSLLAGSLGVHW